MKKILNDNGIKTKDKLKKILADYDIMKSTWWSPKKIRDYIKKNKIYDGCDNCDYIRVRDLEKKLKK